MLEARCENAPWAKQTKEVFYAPGDNMRLVVGKSKVKYDENVLLTTYGCDFGYVEWKIGDNMILGHSLDAKRQITQTGTVVSGGTALLTGTSIAGASYLWTPPAGVSLPVLNTRVLQIPNATTAQAGDYQLKINSGGCEVELSARLDVDL